MASRLREGARCGIAALDSLGSTRHHALAHLDAVLPKLDDPDVLVRLAAAELLAKAYSDERVPLWALGQCTVDVSSVIRAVGCQALGRALARERGGEEEGWREEYLERLSNFVVDTEAKVRRISVQALVGNVGHLSYGIIKKLIFMATFYHLAASRKLDSANLGELEGAQQAAVMDVSAAQEEWAPACLAVLIEVPPPFLEPHLPSEQDAPQEAHDLCRPLTQRVQQWRGRMVALVAAWCLAPSSHNQQGSLGDVPLPVLHDIAQLL